MHVAELVSRSRHAATLDIPDISLPDVKVDTSRGRLGNLGYRFRNLDLNSLRNNLHDGTNRNDDLLQRVG